MNCHPLASPASAATTAPSSSPGGGGGGGGGTPGGVYENNNTIQAEYGMHHQTAAAAGAADISGGEFAQQPQMNAIANPQVHCMSGGSIFPHSPHLRKMR